MKCKHCRQSIKEKKPAIENLYSSFKKENSFEYFMNKTLKRVRNKLKKETERVDELRRQLDSGMIRPFTSKEEKILQVGLTLGQKEMVLKNQLERGK